MKTRLFILLWIGLNLFCSRVGALELYGDASLQARWFPQSPLFAQQQSVDGGIVVEPSLYAELSPTVSLTLSGLYRYDVNDSNRSHGDVREAYLLTYGDWGDTAWEVRVGLGRVFWGVAELHNIVDVVNQLDLVEHPRDRPKLGQPMVHVTLSGDWGIAESFLLPYHRTRTFPSLAGRLRSRFEIETDNIYESDDAEKHLDFALRYSHSVGIVDFGLSAFSGTNRTPTFIPILHIARPPTLIPYYEQISHFGLDLQLTTAALLYKVEAVHREGESNLLGVKDPYSAVILGAERLLDGIFGTPWSLTLLGEWSFDEREELATSVYANDFFIAGFLAFNDVQGTELTVGVLMDLTYGSQVLNLDFKRRLSDRWSIRLEAIVNAKADPEDLTYDSRKDSFLGVGLTVSY